MRGGGVTWGTTEWTLLGGAAVVTILCCGLVSLWFRNRREARAAREEMEEMNRAHQERLAEERRIAQRWGLRVRDEISYTPLPTPSPRAAPRRPRRETYYSSEERVARSDSDSSGLDVLSSFASSVADSPAPSNDCGPSTDSGGSSGGDSFSGGGGDSGGGGASDDW